jgi:hypothetical protein
MRQKPPPAPPTRPHLLDYFLLLGGFAVSLYLMDLHPWSVQPLDSITSEPWRRIIEFLPRLVRLPEGVILFFPLFFLPQFILGRRFEISTGEWLWIIAWCGTALLTGIAVTRALNGLPDWFAPYAQVVRLIWHVGFGTALAVVALVLIIYNLFRRAPMPWTHGFGLALVVWPIPPLVGILLLTKS